MGSVALPFERKGPNAPFRVGCLPVTVGGSEGRYRTVDSCRTHDQVQANGTCRTCRAEFCEPCLVYAYGRSKSPYCLRCALLAVGTTPTDAWTAEYSISA
jgi:hypothetical protein